MVEFTVIGTEEGERRFDCGVWGVEWDGGSGLGRPNDMGYKRIKRPWKEACKRDIKRNSFPQRIFKAKLNMVDLEMGKYKNSSFPIYHN